MLSLRADPWAPEYGMGYEAPAEEAPLPRCDPFVETEDWTRPVVPDPGPDRAVWFVDGVRRVELRVLAGREGRQVPGLFGSYAVGSVACDGGARFDAHRVHRSVVLGSGSVPDPVEVRVGPTRLGFEPATDPRSDPNAPLERLQELMREAEQDLAAELIAGGAPVLLADGPLPWKEAVEAGAPVVGVVKRFVRRYLEPEQESLLGALGPGGRTPVFALTDPDGNARRYSWYARLMQVRPPWHDHAGIVRCEVRAGIGPVGAVEMADRITAVLPRYAGRPGDPRAPQNLAPVAGLEQWLRHRMGDRAMIRRALLSWLAGREG